MLGTLGTRRRLVAAAADEERTGIAQHAVHVMNQLVRHSDLGRGSKRSEFGRSAAESLLSPVCESSLGNGGEEFAFRPFLWIQHWGRDEL
jgi:hypothetical protein